MKTGALIFISDSEEKKHPYATQRIGSISALQRLCMTFHLAKIQPVAIFTDDSDPALEKQLSRMNVIFIRKATGLSDAFKWVTKSCDQVLIAPAEVPLFSVDTVHALLASKKKIAAPVCKGTIGYPVLVHGSCPFDIGWKNNLLDTLYAANLKPTQIKVSDTGIYTTADRPEECEKIALNHTLRQWRPTIKLCVAKESIFLGPGSRQLLSLIESTGCVRTAIELMGLSYSKAWKIINSLEKEVGYPVIVRKKGGRSGGKSYLTEKGKALVVWFAQLEHDCTLAVKEIFDKSLDSLNK